MRTWLIGERGMLGSAVRQELNARHVDFAYTGSELDIADGARVTQYITEGHFTHVVNCAAYTQVDAAEQNALSARRANGVGPANLWRACRSVGADLLHFSTDYVFDGTATAPYPESAETCPLGEYGRSKLEGEIALRPQDTKARAFIVRTSWLFGPDGNHFVKTMLRLMAEKPQLRVVSDQWGRPTYCPDLARAALDLAGIGGQGAGGSKRDPGIYHFANTGQTNWCDFAREILAQARAAGLPIVTQSVEAIATKDYPTPAQRPAYSVLDTTKLSRALGEAPRPWKDALQEYVNQTKR